MSRLCVKNIGKNLTEDVLRSSFSAKGDVTDVRIVRTKDGKSRGFAFVGFRSAKEAESAMQFMNNTYIGTSKIIVELANKINSGEKIEGEKVEPIETTVVPQNKNEISKGGKFYNEFMEVNSKNSTSKSTAIQNESEDEQIEVSNEVSAVEDKELSDMDFLRSKVSKNIQDDYVSNSKMPISTKSLAQDSLYDDFDSNEVHENEAENFDEQKDGETSEYNRLFVRNIPYACNEEELREIFAPYGEISEVHIPINTLNSNAAEDIDQLMNNNSKYNKGYGFVEFLFPECGLNACQALDGSSFQGRILHVIVAKPKMEQSEESILLQNSANKHLSSYQKKLELDRKKLLNKVDGWNSAYVRGESAVESLAASVGVETSQVLNHAGLGAGDLAIAAALGENQVVQENTEYFLKHNVDINTVESVHSKDKANKRSTVALLIKNLKYDSVDEDELESMFAKFGSIIKFLMPSNKSMALVEFAEPIAARAAYRKMAFKRYHNMPLYLEWAPLRDASKGITGEDTVITKAVVEKSNDDIENIGDFEFATFYVSNLNFKTTIDELRSHALSLCRSISKQLGDNFVRNVIIPTKKAANGANLSSGYGFVEVKVNGHEGAFLKALNDSLLDGHKLIAKVSEKKFENTSSSSKSNPASSTVSSSNKLMVHNVPFQATYDELHKLFSVYGNVKSLRLPKKSINSKNSAIDQHRGFAFVEFNSRKECEGAYNQLKNIHLYGRRLVLEYANPGDSGEGFGSLSSGTVHHGGSNLGELREKAKRDMAAIGASSKDKKRKHEVFNEEENEE